MDPICNDGTITYGDFGPAREEVLKASGGGISNYNVEVKIFNGKKHFFFQLVLTVFYTINFIILRIYSKKIHPIIIWSCIRPE